MQMEVMVPAPAGGDFNFDSACTSPFVSAPASPQRFGNYFFSAPTSPTCTSAFYRDFNDHFSLTTTGADITVASSLSEIPFNWEEQHGTMDTHYSISNYEEDNMEFEFDFSGQLERPSLSADELFDGGKIKPLKPPPRLQYTETRVSAYSPKSPKKILKETQSPDDDHHHHRGRERICKSGIKSSDRQKGTRSLSPLRASDMVFDQVQNSKQTSSSSSSSWYRKWKLKDLLLFRSPSEGHKEYASLKKSPNEDMKTSSFRSTDSCSGSVSNGRKKGRVSVSAHEWHYTVNRAAAEEMKRKTFLPYKQGLLGCLGFNSGIRELQRGINGSSFMRE